MQASQYCIQSVVLKVLQSIMLHMICGMMRNVGWYGDYWYCMLLCMSGVNRMKYSIVNTFQGNFFYGHLL